MSFTWRECELFIDELPQLLTAWQADPERALRDFFDYELPASAPEPVGLPREAPVDAKHVTAEDLDF